MSLLEEVERKRARVQRTPRLVDAAVQLRVVQLRQERNQQAWKWAEESGDAARVTQLEAEAERLDDAVDELVDRDERAKEAQGMMEESMDLIQELDEDSELLRSSVAMSNNSPTTSEEEKDTVRRAYEHAKGSQSAGQAFLLQRAQQSAQTPSTPLPTELKPAALCPCAPPAALADRVVGASARGGLGGGIARLVDCAPPGQA
ncbi:hypothetical protein JCM10449v2_008028 [Rhodotorula kratochvilovae]